MTSSCDISIALEPSDGEPMFAFKPGQFVMVHLFEPDGSVWAKTAYSISTAPIESKDRFEIGVRLAGDFTKRMHALKEGDTVGIQGPFGVFTLRDGATRSVFFAGGIGITPIRGMIREALLSTRNQELFLIYCNRSKDMIAYEDDFRVLASSHPNFHPIFVIERDLPDAWDGERGRISADIIKKHLPSLDDTDYYVCGPPPFMDAVRGILEAEGVDVKARMSKETF
jgi:ferredoxin-NADP reductase